MSDERSTEEAGDTPKDAATRGRRSTPVLAGVLFAIAIAGAAMMVMLQRGPAPGPSEAASPSGLAQTESAVASAPRPTGEPGERRTFGGVEYVWIAPGRFTMGMASDDIGRSSGASRHEVVLTKGFWLGVHEITQAQWEAVMAGNPSHFRGPNLPVDQVSWDDVQDFISKLNARVGDAVRLPTEAEWEYACRSGTKTPFSCGKNLSDGEANCDGTGGYGAAREGVFRETTTPIGSFPANAWGLHDMHGNVWEWCEDWHGEYRKGSATDPKGPDTGRYRVLRGGSWRSAPSACRSGNRSWSASGHRGNHVGFRLAW